MPRSTPAPRNFLTRRTMTCEGYLREDGLIDVEGHLVDVRGFDKDNEWRGHLKAGDSAHDMWVRLTVDDDLIIKEAESSTDASPYPVCREVTARPRK